MKKPLFFVLVVFVVLGCSNPFDSSNGSNSNGNAKDDSETKALDEQLVGDVFLKVKVGIMAVCGFGQITQSSRRVDYRS